MSVIILKEGSFFMTFFIDVILIKELCNDAII